ncbi:MAG: hypothetical protein QT11_C0001G0534 [archaeon GW2011_AR20]|nr:MAG: hypothetical protein QT11_C0001G0534 [archaeon GW2011_AR20]AQS28207.1 hypothetical protein [uncultured archaeon]MBS3160498.1 alkaline phosphatase family protein [Candidatus Woesearchaeota archaeon]
MGKVFIMGIDGGSLDLINKWRNDLPNFDKLIKNGTSGYLHTIIPMLTPPAWTSFFTGKNPGKHNIYDFFKFNDYDKNLISSYDRKAESVCDILSRHNKKSIVLNLPINYPPQPVNGIVVSGGEAPSIETDFTYPKEFKKKIFELIPDYKIGIDWNNIEYQKHDEFIKDLYNVTESHKKLILDLLKNEQWDLFIAVFEDIDRLQHYFWKYMDSNHPFYIKGNKYETAIHDYYKELDNVLGEIINNLPQDTFIFVMSDHGFGPIYKQIFINNFLLENGFLQLKENDKNKVNVRDFLIRLAYKLKIKHLIPKLSKETRDKLKRIIPSNNPTFFDIDWGNTKAYFNSYSGQCIFINFKGRQKDGIVEESEYKNLLNNLKERLLRLEDNGKRVIKNVYFSDEIYKGENLKNAPDIYVVTEEGYVLQEGFNSKLIDGFDESKVHRSGEHRDNGILILNGTAIRQDYNLEASILDIAPTILNILKVPVPEDLDGKSIQCFN